MARVTTTREAHGARHVARGGNPNLAVLRRTWLGWTVMFVGYPLGGVLGIAAGPVDDPGTALIGGAATGAVIGLSQWLVLRRHVPSAWRWVPATAAGLAVGLAGGSAVVGYSTTIGALAIQGAFSGAAVGAAQAGMLARTVGRHRALAWAAAAPPLWALGWAVTTAAGVSVDRQFTVFGASGALTMSIVGGVLLVALLRGRSDDRP